MGSVRKNRITLKPSSILQMQLENEYGASNVNTLLPTLLYRFQGDFDNYEQVLSDRQKEKFPRESGGHEHFHVTLIPLPIDFLPDALYPIEKKESSCGAVVAAYYFDGMPNRIFRLRVYTMYSENVDKEGGIADEVNMKLFTVDPVLEEKLRQESENAVQKWPSLIEQHVSQANINNFQELDRCDIKWSRKADTIRHSYLTKYTSLGREHKHPIHAIMMNDHAEGGVLLESQMMPGSMIRIQDELSLWEDALWINDRGHDAESKAMIYGNWDGVPYQMKRVASLKLNDSHSVYERTVIDDNLSWTMGSNFRTAEVYEAKMNAIGGCTTKMNQKRQTRSQE